MSDVKLSPPAVNLWLYATEDSSATSVITFRWPPTSLAGRTFAALITGDSLTAPIAPTVIVVDDDVIVTVAPADVATLIGARAHFELRETTSGRPEPIIAGFVQVSGRASKPTLGLVEVLPVGIGAWLLEIDGGTVEATGSDVVDGGGV